MLQARVVSHGILFNLLLSYLRDLLDYGHAAVEYVCSNSYRWMREVNTPRVITSRIN